MWIVEIEGNEEVFLTKEQLTDLMLGRDSYDNIYLRPIGCFPWVNLAEYYNGVTEINT